MTRFKATALHFAITLLVMALLTAIVLPLWHPWGLYRISGVLPLLGLLLGALLAAGPLLTLIVFKPGKKTLRMDITVLGILQLAVLGGGTYLLAQTRPAFVVTSDMRMAVVLASEIDPADLAQAAQPEWTQLPWGKPRLVGLRPGTQRTDQNSVLAAFLNTGMDHEQQPRWYVPYADITPRLAFTAKPSTADAQPAPATSQATFHSLPIVARHGAGRVVLDADWQPVKIVSY